MLNTQNNINSIVFLFKKIYKISTQLFKYELSPLIKKIGTLLLRI